jgi:hypothetical protein
VVGCAVTRGLITVATTLAVAPRGELELDGELPGLEDSLAINAVSVQQTRFGQNKHIVSVARRTTSQVSAYNNE